MPTQSTETLIEEALKDFRSEFCNDYTKQTGDFELKRGYQDNPQDLVSDMEDFLKKLVSTIATKSAEESLINLYFEGDELVITKGKWVIDRYKRNDL